MKKTRVTAKQLEILKFIIQQQKIHFRTPSLTEIGEYMDFESPNQGARFHVMALERKGIIERIKGASRLIKVLKRVNQVEVKQWNAK